MDSALKGRQSQERSSGGAGREEVALAHTPPFIIKAIIRQGPERREGVRLVDN